MKCHCTEVEDLRNEVAWLRHRLAEPRTTLFGYDVTMLGQGSRVLVSTHNAITAEHASRMKAILEERFPGVQFTILSAAHVTAVQP